MRVSLVRFRPWPPFFPRADAVVIVLTLLLCVREHACRNQSVSKRLNDANGDGIQNDDPDMDPNDGDQSAINDIKVSLFVRDAMNNEAPRTRSVATVGLSAGRVLAVAAQLGLVSRLAAVIAAVLPVRSLGFDHALTRRVRTLGRSSHDVLRLGLYARM